MVPGSVDLHRAWIEDLLHEYYDPMYVHRRQAKGERVEFVGDLKAVKDYLAQRG